MSSLTSFKTRFAGLAARADDERINELLADAASECSARVWGTYWLRAVLYLAAHMLVMELAQEEALATAGAIGGVAIGAGGAASMTTGRESISFAGPRLAGRADMSLSDAVLAGTSYGQEYLRLREKLYLGPLVV